MKNQKLIEQLKNRSALGIVMKRPIVNKSPSRIPKPFRRECFSEEPKPHETHPEESIIDNGPGLESTEFFKTLVGETKEKKQIAKLSSMNPIERKKVLNEMSKQRHFMLPLEIKQLKKALQAEDQLSSSPLLIKDFSKIDGKSPYCDSPRGHKLNMDDDLKFSKSVNIDTGYQNNNLPIPLQVKNLPPKLKEIFAKNKNMLSKIVIE